MLRLYGFITLVVSASCLCGIANFFDYRAPPFVARALLGVYPPIGYTEIVGPKHYGWPLMMRTQAIAKTWGRSYEDYSEVETISWRPYNALLNILTGLLLIIPPPLVLVLNWQPKLGWRFSLSTLICATVATAFWAFLFSVKDDSQLFPWWLKACLWTQAVISGLALGVSMQFAIDRLSKFGGCVDAKK